MVDSDFEAQITRLDGIVHRLEAAVREGGLGLSALGTSLPGTEALPAFTLLGLDPSSRALEYDPGGGCREFALGDILKLHGSLPHGPIGDIFVSPIGSTIVHALGLSYTEARSNPRRIAYRIRGAVAAGTLELQCAVLPWRLQGPGPVAGETAVLNDLRHFALMAQTVRVTLELPTGQSIRLRPEWGVRPARLERWGAGIRAVAARAASVLAGTICRVDLAPFATAGSNPGVLDGVLAYELDEVVWRRMQAHQWEVAGASIGIAVIPQAMPVVNLELKMWPASQGFRSFQTNSGGEFVSLAGVGVHRPEYTTLGRGLQSMDFSLRVDWDRSGQEDVYYDLFAADVQKHASDPLVMTAWITRADAINGAAGEYSSDPPGHERESKWQYLEGMRTMIPFMGGIRLKGSLAGDGPSSVRFTVPPQPQVFLFADGIITAFREALQNFGYPSSIVYHDARSPRTTVRSVGGRRQRVMVVEIDSRKCNLRETDMRALEAHLSSLVPGGFPCVIDVVDRPDKSDWGELP